MSDRYIEKNFLWLLALSVLLHLAAYKIIPFIPVKTPKAAEQTTMVDLSDLPSPPPMPPPKPVEPPKPPPEAKPKPQPPPLPSLRPEADHPAAERFSDKPRRVEKQTAPRVEDRASRPDPLPQGVPAPTRPAERPQTAIPTRPSEPVPLEKGGSAPVARGEGIFKPRSPERAAPKLFPSANRLARLEEGYRKRYAADLEEGETSFLNTDDIRFGSFLRRLETAVYGVWRYPHEAMIRGIEGTTPVRITFNKKGEIVQVELLETSGSEILDNEVMRTLKVIGPVGSFPRGYTSDTFRLIAFFHYGNGHGRIH